jgi:hypothetical protein
MGPADRTDLRLFRTADGRRYRIKPSYVSNTDILFFSVVACTGIFCFCCYLQRSWQDIVFICDRDCVSISVKCVQGSVKSHTSGDSDTSFPLAVHGVFIFDMVDKEKRRLPCVNWHSPSRRLQHPPQQPIGKANDRTDPPAAAQHDEEHRASLLISIRLFEPSP